MQLSADMAAPFLQEANFLYLTGISEPDWWLIVDGNTGKEWLVTPERDAIKAVFDGGMTAAEATKKSGIDTIVTHEEAEEIMQKLAAQRSTVYTVHNTARGADFVANPAQEQLHTRLKAYFKEVKDAHRILSRQRAIKQPEEIAAMKRAVDLTVHTLNSVKSTLSAKSYEYEVDAQITGAFRSVNATHAYEPIIAGGKNACTLHYQSNSEQLPVDGMVLIDVGARVEGYAADVTRTFSIGNPSKRQRAVHQAVAEAQEQITALLKNGYEVREYSTAVDQIMKNALLSLGLISKKSSEREYRQYFPHAISHGLGLDVHESLGGTDVFKTGMVLTVEPGIYVPEWDVGVRIEDDILITDHAVENLSAHVVYV